MQIVGGNGRNQFRQYPKQNAGNPAGYNDVIRNQNQIGNGNLVAARAEGNAAGQNGNQIRCYNCRGKEEAGIQLQAEEYNLMAAAADLDEIEEVNANCISMANLQQASTSGTQTDSVPVYDTNGSAEVHENCDDNEIFNMFTQEEQYTELLEPIPESHQVPHNDNDVISADTSVEQGGEIVEQHPANFEETRALYESLHQNLAIEVEKVNSVNRKLKETNTDLTTELARCFEISQEKYDKLERCYQQSVYQEQCLFKKINALHLSTGKQIMTLNEQISDLNKQLSKEKSTVSFLFKEKKRLKSDFKTCEDKLLDKQILLEKRIKELNNIVLKTGQSIQTIHMLSPKPNLFYHTEQKMALDLSDDKTLSVARKFLNEIKSTIVTLQHVVKQRMTIETHNWASFAHQELHKIKRDENFPIVNQVDARLQNFEIQFLKEATKSVRDFKSLANEADASLAKHKIYKLSLNVRKNALKTVSLKRKLNMLNFGMIDTQNPLSRKLKNENVELEFQVLNYARENAHLKATYKNLFDSISVSRNLKLLINFVRKLMGTVRFGNDHVAAILGFGDLQWGNILITRVHFIEGLGHNFFSVGQFCDSNLEVAFRRNACFVRNLEGVDLLKGEVITFSR
nr:integrase, catalytic region, zinc finger, CCHC-type, peptidase aspartic, catalytic [Tanacetum cinerariifolium]